MPWIVGDTERGFAGLGFIVAVAVGLHFRCWMCGKGELLLTRAVDSEGRMRPAHFECAECHDITNTRPDSGTYGMAPGLSVDALKNRRTV